MVLRASIQAVITARIIATPGIRKTLPSGRRAAAAWPLAVGAGQQRLGAGPPGTGQNLETERPYLPAGGQPIKARPGSLNVSKRGDYFCYIQFDR